MSTAAQTRIECLSELTQILLFSYKQKRSQLVKLLQNRLMAQYKKVNLFVVIYV